MNNKSEKILICGREFTEKELDNVIETVKLFPNLSRNELAHTICEHLNWFLPTGNYKKMSALSLLEKLQAEGLIQLPDKKTPGAGLSKQKYKNFTSKTDPSKEILGTVSDYEPIVLEQVKDKKTKDLWNEYIERYHILGYKQPFGARQRYFIVSKAGTKPRRLGCLLFSSAAWALAPRDEWIGWNESDRSKYLNGIVNNTRFLIFPWVKVKNLASKSLSLAAKRICTDWLERYNYQPVLLETFVDEKQYRGTCYQAANWKYLGKTKGRGRMDRYKQYLSSPKLIYVYPLVKNFRAYLTGKRPEWRVR